MRFPKPHRTQAISLLLTPFLVDLADFVGVALDGCGSPMRPPLLACLSDPGLDPVPQNLALELGEDREQAFSRQGRQTFTEQTSRFTKRRAPGVELTAFSSRICAQIEEQPADKKRAFAGLEVQAARHPSDRQ